MDNEHPLRSTGEDLEDLHWAEALRIISMDVAAVFANELGLETMPLGELRSIARRLLEETGAAWDYDVSVSGLSRTFLREVASRLSADTAESLVEWFRQTFPADRECITICYQAFQVLQEDWDESEDISQLPLGARDCTHYRLLVREYVARHAVLHGETRLLGEGLSEWDDLFETRLMADYVSSVLYAALVRRVATSWMPVLRSTFPTEEAQAVAQWWTGHRWPQECLRLLIAETRA